MGFAWVITCLLYAIEAPRVVMATAIFLTGLLAYIDFLVFMGWLAAYNLKKLEKLQSTSPTLGKDGEKSINK